jgi:hypothetical protein
MYANKTEIARVFGVSTPTVYKRIKGIEQEIGSRYNRYALLDGLVSIEVYADYEKYHKRLNNRNLRKTVPPFDMAEARAYLTEGGMLHVVCKEIKVPY